MITREMVKTLQEIRRQQQSNGAALTTKIEVYEHRTTLYRTLEKLVNLQAAERQEAPNTAPVKNTYTVTDFGEKLIERCKEAEMI